MLPAPKREEIDHRTIKLIVGIVAISLAALTSVFATNKITSISASYYEGGLSQAIFIGFLFAIAAYLLAYNGLSKTEMLLSKAAAVAALGVALFPCECAAHVVLPYVHGVAATAMFLILAYFCYCFYRRAREKGYPQAKARAAVYAVCGVAILASVVCWPSITFRATRWCSAFLAWCFMARPSGWSPSGFHGLPPAGHCRC